MSIVGGFVCTDGVLIAADTEITHGTSHKLEQTKVRRDSDAAFGEYVIGGAGTMSYIDMAMDMIKEGFYLHKAKAMNDTDDDSRDYTVRDALGSTMRRLHKHMKACHHHGLEVPYVELLVSVQGLKEPAKLFHIEADGAVHRIRDAEVFVGAGNTIAVAFSRILIRESLNLELAKWAAFFILYQAKISGYGCGGATEQFRIPRYTSPQIMKVYDDAVIAKQVEKAMRLCLLDSRNAAITAEQLDKRIGEFYDTVREIRAAISAPDFSPFMMEAVRRLRPIPVKTGG